MRSKFAFCWICHGLYDVNRLRKMPDTGAVLCLQCREPLTSWTEEDREKLERDLKEKRERERGNKIGSGA